jgi:hypothetical protein
MNVVARGEMAPWTTQAKAARGFEGARTSNVDDLPGWRDLI